MGIYEFIKVIGLVCLLSGCASNGSQNIKYGAEPYIEGTTTIEKLKEIGTPAERNLWLGGDR